VSEINGHRREVARCLGLQTYLPTDEDFRERVRADFDGIGPDIVFDATGSAPGYQSAVDVVRVRGRLVQVGIPKGAVELDLRRLNFAEITVIGTRVYEPVDIVTAIGLLGSGRVGTAGIVSTHALDDCGGLLAELSSGRSELMKPVLVIGK